MRANSPFPRTSPVGSPFPGFLSRSIRVDDRHQGLGAGAGQNAETVTTDTSVTRFVVGLNGEFGPKWSWDWYYQYGKTKRSQIGQGYTTNWRMYMATDAVIDTRAGLADEWSARVPCAVIAGVPDPTVDPALIAGCRRRTSSVRRMRPKAALAYAFGDLTESDDVQQQVLSAMFTVISGGCSARVL